MAVKVGEIFYEVTADTAGLVTAEKQVDKSIDKMETAFSAVTAAVLELSANIKVLVEATKQQSRSNDAAATAADHLATATKNAATAAKSATTTTTQATTATKKQTAAAKDLADAEDKAAEATKKRKKEQGAGPRPATPSPSQPTTSPTGASNAGGGLSPKALAAAQRNIPAQFTDIVTGLGSGQSPFTVLLQQGGQLKDMFGGVGAAAKALGSYVAGLLTPFTALAAAAALLVVGLVKGRQETDEIRKSIELTGNQSGETVDTINALAASLDNIAGVTRGKAAEALTEFVAAGVRGGESLGKFTEAAIRLEQVGGPAVADTAKAFRELGKDPVGAALKLNESVNFLTSSVYRQIKALQDQGKTVEAARVAQEAYADAILKRTPNITNNLGFLEKAWKSVANAAKEGWDALLNIGRQKTPEEALANTRKQIELIEKQLRGGGFDSTGGGAATGRGIQPKQRAALEQQLAGLREQVQLYEKSQTLQKDAANDQAKQAATTAALAQFDRDGEKFLSQKVKMEREIEQARTLGAAAGLKAVEIEDRIAAIRKSYGVGAKSDAAQAYYQGLVAANATALAQINAQEQQALAENRKRQQEDSANAAVYGLAKIEIQKKFARERAMLEEKTTQEVADLNIAITTDEAIRIGLIREEAFRRAEAEEKLGVKTHDEAERAKTLASFQAAQARAAINERLDQTIAENRIASTTDEITRIDLIRQESFRRIDAQARAGVITHQQAEAEKARATIEAQNAIRQQVLSINPVAALEQEYQQKLAIVQFYEQAMAQAGINGAMFVEQKRAELANQYQQQRQQLMEAEFVAQGEAQKFLVDTLNSLGSTATSTITGLITGTMSAADAMRNLGMVVLNEAVGALVQIGLQYIKNAIMSQAADRAMMASKAANAALYATAVTAQVGVTTALAAQAAFASTAAIPIVGPFAAPAAAAAAAAAAGALGAPAIAAAPIAGAKAYGGAVNSGSLYRVGEKGPEMFVGNNGNQYMVPGQGGKVVPNDELGGGKVMVQVLVNNNHPSAEVSTRTDDNGRLVELTISEISNQFASNSGPAWSALTGASNVRGQLA